MLYADGVLSINIYISYNIFLYLQFCINICELPFVNLEVEDAEKVFEDGDDVDRVDDSGDVTVEREAETRVEGKKRLADERRGQKGAEESGGERLFAGKGPIRDPETQNRAHRVQKFQAPRAVHPETKHFKDYLAYLGIFSSQQHKL